VLQAVDERVQGVACQCLESALIRFSREMLGLNLNRSCLPMPRWEYDIVAYESPVPPDFFWLMLWVHCRCMRWAKIFSRQGQPACLLPNLSDVECFASLTAMTGFASYPEYC